MAQAFANGIDLEYELAGPANGPVVLLIMGLAAQMTAWPPEFLASLHKAGYRTLRFDNRDIGKSSKIHHRRPPGFVQQVLRKRIGLPGGAPYTLETMAKDAEGLLNALGIGKVHVVGVSMGGMIGQVFAAKYPARTLSFTGIMTSTNNRALPKAEPHIMKALINRPKAPETRQQAIDRSVAIWELIGTQASGDDPEERRERIAEAFDRSYYPVGPARQIAAIGETGDLRRYTRKIKVPALIVHGADDPLVPKEAGMDIAKNIPHGQLELIDGMAHDLPRKHLPKITAMLISHFENAENERKEALAAE